MKLAMAQMSMSDDAERNLQKSLSMIEAARGCDLLFFPEIQLSPFFPQYEGRDVSSRLLRPDDPAVARLCAAARQSGLYCSPNLYLELGGRPFDTSLWISPEGEIEGMAKMVHVMQARQFYEKDYYTPSDDGFKVFDTPFGRVGIVICFDRHLPESIRTCAVLGAQLVIIPTANTSAEPMEMFEWEVRVQAMQNGLFAAMCNRVGREGDMDFCGQSLLVSPDGDVLLRAGGEEGLLTAEIDLRQADEARARRPYLSTRRPEMYR